MREFGHQLKNELAMLHPAIMIMSRFRLGDKNPAARIVIAVFFSLKRTSPFCEAFFDNVHGFSGFFDLQPYLCEAASGQNGRFRTHHPQFPDTWYADVLSCPVILQYLP